MKSLAEFDKEGKLLNGDQILGPYQADGSKMIYARDDSSKVIGMLSRYQRTGTVELKSPIQVDQFDEKTEKMVKVWITGEVDLMQTKYTQADMDGKTIKETFLIAIEKKESEYNEEGYKLS